MKAIGDGATIGDGITTIGATDHGEITGAGTLIGAIHIGADTLSTVLLTGTDGIAHITTEDTAMATTEMATTAETMPTMEEEEQLPMETEQTTDTVIVTQETEDLLTTTKETLLIRDQLLLYREEETLIVRHRTGL